MKNLKENGIKQNAFLKRMKEELPNEISDKLDLSTSYKVSRINSDGQYVGKRCKR